MAQKHRHAFEGNSSFDAKSVHIKDSIRAHSHLAQTMTDEIRSAKRKEPRQKTVAPQYSIPAVLYLEGLCALVLTFAHTSFVNSFQKSYLNPFLFQMALPMLFLLLGYRMARRASEAGIGFYGRRYLRHILSPNLAHYILPMAFMYLVYLAIVLSQGVSLGGFSTIFFDFTFGRWGTKSSSVYFGWMALELILLLPILLNLRNRNERKWPWWLVHIFLFSLLYEFIINALDSASVEMAGNAHDIYRFFPFRFLFVFALGMYIYQRRKRKKVWALYILSFSLGIGYLIFIGKVLLPNGRLPNWLPLFQDRPFTSMFSSFYIFPIVTVILHFAQRKSLPKILDVPLFLLGKASYYIILAQAVLFGVMEKLELSLPGSLVLQAILSLLICSAAGILLYLISVTRLSSAVSGIVSRLFQKLGLTFGVWWRKLVIVWCYGRMHFLKKRLARLTKKHQNSEV